MDKQGSPLQFSSRSLSFTGIASDARTQFIIVLALSITIIISKLGGNGLANYDDCFYAQKAKEILHTGEWMTMHFNNQPAWENPPLFIWFIALSYKLFGVNEFAAKFPSALFGVATVCLLYVIGRKFYGAWV